jgi:heme exporter protein D
MNMLGIPDPQIWLAYLLSVLSAVLCVVYGVVKWNSND